jgi:two-component system OmpR family response regulator
VVRGGRLIDLSPREFKLLEFMLRNQNRVVTRVMLLERVWDFRFDPHTSVIDTHVSRLRKSLEGGFDEPILHTVRGAGYRLSEKP